MGDAHASDAIERTRIEDVAAQVAGTSCSTALVVSRKEAPDALLTGDRADVCIVRIEGLDAPPAIVFPGVAESIRMSNAPTRRCAASGNRSFPTT